jgi:Gluconate 2-dehydrogenase subunit 3
MSRFADAAHLPKAGGSGAPPDPHRHLPRQRRGRTPQMHGRYPDYDVLEQIDHWDAETAAVVRRRVDHVPDLGFFSPDEARTLTAFCDDVLAQDAEPRVPVLAFVDEKLRNGWLDGYRYDDMPDDRETWRVVAAGLDEAAREDGETGYASAPRALRESIVDRFAAGELTGGVWGRVNVARAYGVVMRAALAAFYSHPWAWNEIGFGGPAYPRGYARLGVGLSEAWEGREAVDVDPVGDVREQGLE